MALNKPAATGLSEATSAAIPGMDLAAVPLSDLAARINDEHLQAEHHARTAVEHALRCGELLIEAKAQVSHGQWLPWLKANCTVSERTAQAYMRLARELPALEPGKAQRVADLPLRDALRALSAPEARLPVGENPASELLSNQLDELRQTDAELRQIEARIARREQREEMGKSLRRDMDAFEIQHPQLDVDMVRDPAIAAEINGLITRCLEYLYEHARSIIADEVDYGRDKIGRQFITDIEKGPQGTFYKLMRDCGRGTYEEFCKSFWGRYGMLHC